MGRQLIGAPEGGGGGGGGGGSTMPIIHRVRVTYTNATPSTEVPVQLPVGPTRWEIVGFSQLLSSGSAAAMAPSLGETAGYSGLDERVLYKAATTTKVIRDVYAAPVPVIPDGSFRLYLRPGFNAGSNNSGTTEIWIRQAAEVA